MNLVEPLYFFALYAFMGWILEFAYRSVRNGRLINPGFLSGPFLPLYGTGAGILILVSPQVSILHPALQFLIYFFLTSCIEYATGFIFEKLYGVKLWDYYDQTFHLHGRVSLTYSLAWAGLSMAFVYFFHPGMRELLMGEKWFSYLSLAGGSFIAVDAFFSFRAMERVMERLSYIFNNYLELTTQELQELLNSMKRQLAAFNSLRRILSRSMGEGIEKKLPQPLKKLLGTLENKAIDQRFNDLEYLEIVADILSNEDFLKLKEFPHHDATIYDHVRKVSYLSYRLCRNLNLDYRSAARGGLLHDFFLYDWKDSGPRPYRGGLHGFKHPRVALLNSMTHFNLNDIEYDIILKHMWPLTIKPPQYRESYIVSMVDKYISSGEFFNGVYQLPRRIREKKTSML